jgi:transcriptional regulator with XRE-family HTH domain
VPEDVDAAGVVSLGGLVRAHRGRLGLTQEQLAERAGLSERTLRNLERGRIRRPYPDTVRRLADALELAGRPRGQFEVAARGVARALAPEAAVPSLLPPAVADFTGREHEVASVLELLAPDSPQAHTATVVISAVAGKPGIGKTTLAVHVAHRLRTQFPDGQLYVNLRGTLAQPLAVGEVLARFLRALGVEGTSIPDELEERAERYRTLLADRRMLVVLDNAAGEAQVRPLLPGSPTCRVLITSRARLTGLEGAQLVPGAAAARRAAADGLDLPEELAPVYLHRQPGFAFDPALSDIARSRDVATARWVAKTLQYPATDPRLSGPAWPWP